MQRYTYMIQLSRKIDASLQQFESQCRIQKYYIGNGPLSAGDDKKRRASGVPIRLKRQTSQKSALYRQATIKNRRASAVPIRIKRQTSQKSALYRPAKTKNRRAGAVPIRLKRQISRKSTLYRPAKTKKSPRMAANDWL